MSLSKRRSSLVRRLHRSKTREREGKVLIEGVRAVVDTLQAGCVPDFAALAPRGRELGGEALATALDRAGVETFEVDDATFDDLGATETGQGILLVVEEPAPDPGELADARRLLVLDGVQDPGNVGTLIRSAAALGCDAVVALDGTCDPWNAKTVRAAAGAGFRIPVHRLGADDLAARWSGRTLVAEAGGRPVHRLDPVGGSPWALVIGSEGSGPRASLLEAADHWVSIPLSAGVESLNAGVAGAILLHALLHDPRFPGDPDA